MTPCCDKFNGASFPKNGVQVCRYCRTPVPQEVLDADPCFEMAKARKMTKAEERELLRQIMQ